MYIYWEPWVPLDVYILGTMGPLDVYILGTLGHLDVYILGTLGPP